MFDMRKSESTPKHQKNKTGVVFVVGTHPCVHDDVAAAAKKFPGSDVCAVNDATDLILADHIVTVHPEKLDQFLENHNCAEIHTRVKMKRPDPRENEYVWDIKLGGGSGLFAVCVMLAIGYEKIIMCGCPMDGGGGYAIKKHDGTVEDPRIGELSNNAELVRGYHSHLKRFRDKCQDAHRVCSMSGFTKKIFGGI
jgi:hypothetical protein